MQEKEQRKEEQMANKEEKVKLSEKQKQEQIKKKMELELKKLRVQLARMRAKAKNEILMNGCASASSCIVTPKGDVEIYINKHFKFNEDFDPDDKEVYSCDHCPC